MRISLNVFFEIYITNCIEGNATLSVEKFNIGWLI